MIPGLARTLPQNYLGPVETHIHEKQDVFELESKPSTLTELFAFAAGVRHARFFAAQNPIRRFHTHLLLRMKLKHTLTASLLLALGVVASLRAQEVKFPAGAAPAPAAAQPAAQFTEAQVLETLGWYLGKQNGFAELGFSKEQVDQLVKGIQGAAAGKDSPYDLDKIGPEITKFMQVKQQAYVGKLKDQGKVEGEKFFTELKTKKGVTVLPSGLGYEILKTGTGDFPKATDKVKVFYTGTLLNGNKFDRNVGGEPVEFQLNGVIPGWSEGIQKINKGGKIKLYVPSQLAYGEEGNQGIPPNSALIFEVELLDINAPAPAAPAAQAAPANAKPEAKK